MKPRIVYTNVIASTDEGPSRSLYEFKYYDDRGNEGALGQGSTYQQGLAELYLQMHQRGYPLSRLPRPERGYPYCADKR